MHRYPGILFTFVLLGAPLAAGITPEELLPKLEDRLEAEFPCVYRLQTEGVAFLNAKNQEEEIESINRELQPELRKPEAERNVRDISLWQKRIESIKNEPLERAQTRFVIAEFATLDRWKISEILKTNASSETTTYYSPGNGIVFGVRTHDKTITMQSGIHYGLACHFPYLPQFILPPITAKNAGSFNVLDQDGLLVLTRRPPQTWTIHPQTFTVLSYVQTYADHLYRQSALKDGVYRYDAMWPGTDVPSEKWVVKEIKIEKPKEPINPDFTIPAGYMVRTRNEHGIFLFSSERLGEIKASAVTPELLETLCTPGPRFFSWEEKWLRSMDYF